MPDFFSCKILGPYLWQAVKDKSSKVESWKLAYISFIMLTLFASSFVRIYQKLWELSGFLPWLNFCGHPVHVSYSINISGIPVRQLVPVYRTFLMTYRYEYRTCIPVSIPRLYPLPSCSTAPTIVRVWTRKNTSNHLTLYIQGGPKKNALFCFCSKIFVYQYFFKISSQ